MKVVLSFLALLISNVVSAEVVNSGSIPVNTEIRYVELVVQAKCRGPQFEDDSAHTYFSPKSYAEVGKYMDQGYRYVLIGRTCGKFGSNTELSADTYETVKILLFNVGAAEKSISSALDDLLQSYK